MSQESQKLFAKHSFRTYRHNPDGTGAVITSPDAGTTKRYLDGSLFRRFGFLAKPTIIGGNGITLAEIVASADAAFTTPYVIKTSGAIQADALDDFVAMECTDQEVAQKGSENGVSLRYVALRLTHATATDESAVTLIGSEPRYPADGLTATAIS